MFKIEDNAGARGNRCKRAMDKYRLEMGRRLLLEQCSDLQDRVTQSKIFPGFKMEFQMLELYAVVSCSGGNWKFGKSFPLLTWLTREIFGYNQSSFRRSQLSLYGHSLNFSSSERKQRNRMRTVLFPQRKPLL